MGMVIVLPADRMVRCGRRSSALPGPLLCEKHFFPPRSLLCELDAGVDRRGRPRAVALGERRFVGEEHLLPHGRLLGELNARVDMRRILRAQMLLVLALVLLVRALLYLRLSFRIALLSENSGRIAGSRVHRGGQRRHKLLIGHCVRQLKEILLVR